MKIIKMGVSPKTTFVRTCPKCSCVFEYTSDEVESYNDQKEGFTVWYIPCPCCSDKTGFTKPEDQLDIYQFI